MDEETMALAMIRDHIVDCTRARQETKEALKDLSNLFTRFISALIAVLLMFGGYYFIQSQSLAAQVATARVTQAQALRDLPEVTASKVVAKVNQTQPQDVPQ